MRAALFLATVALAGCETLPAVVITGGDTFDVRYDAAAHTAAQVDARAREHCRGAAELVSQETRYDGFAYRTYRCVGS